MSIKLFLLKLAAKKGRRQAVRYVQSLGHVKGQKFMVPRETAKPVMVYLYRPSGGGENLPVVFNVHGGAWVGGDALLLDTQSQEMADCLDAMVVNINYVKADVKPFPYAQYEIRDTICYFADHAKEYNIDTQRFAVIGYSAGGHLSACAAQLLQQDGLRLVSVKKMYVRREVKMQLTKYEKETIILFNESEDEASIYTYNAGLKTRLEKFSREYPQFCRLKEKNRYGGRMYLVDKTRLSIHLQPPYSEKRIETVTRNLLKTANDKEE